MIIVIQDNVGKKYTSEEQLKALGFTNLGWVGADPTLHYKIFSVFNTPWENRIGLDYNDAFIEQSLCNLGENYVICIQDEPTLNTFRAAIKKRFLATNDETFEQKLVYDGKLYTINALGQYNSPNPPFHEPFFSIEDSVFAVLFKQPTRLPKAAKE